MCVGDCVLGCAMPSLVSSYHALACETWPAADLQVVRHI